MTLSNTMSTTSSTSSRSHKDVSATIVSPGITVTSKSPSNDSSNIDKSYSPSPERSGVDLLMSLAETASKHAISPVKLAHKLDAASREVTDDQESPLRTKKRQLEEPSYNNKNTDEKKTNNNENSFEESEKRQRIISPASSNEGQKPEDEDATNNYNNISHHGALAQLSAAAAVADDMENEYQHLHEKDKQKYSGSAAAAALYYRQPYMSGHVPPPGYHHHHHHHFAHPPNHHHHARFVHPAAAAAAASAASYGSYAPYPPPPHPSSPAALYHHHYHHAAVAAGMVPPPGAMCPPLPHPSSATHHHPPGSPASRTPQSEKEQLIDELINEHVTSSSFSTKSAKVAHSNSTVESTGDPREQQSHPYPHNNIVPGSWSQRVHPMVISRECNTIPSANKCFRLEQPLPSKFCGDEEETANITLPDFHYLVNYPDYLAKGRGSTGSARSVAANGGRRNCVMCGKPRICSSYTPISGGRPARTGNNSKRAFMPGCSAGSGDESTTHIIPRQNKGVCTACDVAVWVVNKGVLPGKPGVERVEIKWCKGCKNFRPWASFGSKGFATKCARCRDRQKEKYAQQKSANRRKPEVTTSSVSAS